MSSVVIHVPIVIQMSGLDSLFTGNPIIVTYAANNVPPQILNI